MSSNVPTVRPIAWISVVLQLTLMGLLILLWYQLKADNPFFNGALTYLILSFALRTLIPHNHKAGMTLVKQEKYLDAISHFKNSYDFFKRYEWLDKYRYLTLLSSAKMSYKEMALNNIAFCFGQMGDRTKSKEYYELTLQEFPNSGMARAGLNMLNATDTSTTK